MFKHKVNVSITVCLQDAAPPEEQEEARKWLTWRMWCFLAAFSCSVISLFMSAYLLTVNQDKTQSEQKGDIFSRDAKTSNLIRKVFEKKRKVFHKTHRCPSLRLDSMKLSMYYISDLA